MKWVKDFLEKHFPKPLKFVVDLITDGSGKSATSWMGLVAGHCLSFCLVFYVVSQVGSLDPLVIGSLAVPVAGLAGFTYNQKKKAEKEITLQENALSQPDTTSDKSSTVTTDGDGGVTESKTDTATSEKSQ